MAWPPFLTYGCSWQLKICAQQSRSHMKDLGESCAVKVICHIIGVCMQLKLYCVHD